MPLRKTARSVPIAPAFDSEVVREGWAQNLALGITIARSLLLRADGVIE